MTRDDHGAAPVGSPAQAEGLGGTHERVLTALGLAITGGQLPPGTVMTLAGLEEEHRVSRTVAREVVRVLEDHGMVASRRRVGITVRPRSDWDVLDSSVLRWRLAGPQRAEQVVELMELRAAVEPVAARLAAHRASPEQVAELSRLAAELDRLGALAEGRSPEYLRADVAFHALLLAASGNALLGRLADPVREILTARTEHGQTPSVPDPAALRGHLDVAAGVAAADADLAEAGARTYVAVVATEVESDGS